MFFTTPFNACSHYVTLNYQIWRVNLTGGSWRFTGYWH